MARPCIELNVENATLEEVRVAMDCTPTKKGAFDGFKPYSGFMKARAARKSPRSHASVCVMCCASSRHSTSPTLMA